MITPLKNAGEVFPMIESEWPTPFGCWWNFIRSLLKFGQWHTPRGYAIEDGNVLVGCYIRWCPKTRFRKRRSFTHFHSVWVDPWKDTNGLTHTHILSYPHIDVWTGQGPQDFEDCFCGWKRGECSSPTSK